MLVLPKQSAVSVFEHDSGLENVDVCLQSTESAA